MLFNSSYKDWFFNFKGDFLSGIVVALALIPEAIAFSIIAGVDPKVGLYASFSIAVVTAFSGGRPGMISAATGAMALLITNLVKCHGLQYLLAATILTGILQIVAGYLKFGDHLRFVSRSVIVGFVNALAILIFLAQLPELTDVSWHVYAMTALGLIIIYLFPYINKSIPSPLVCITVLTIISLVFKLPIRTIGDMGSLPDTLPVFLLPQVPLNIETFKIIFPYSLALAVVGILESMMTATIVDEMTDTGSDKNRECKAQGIANIVTGFIGGMAGCAMIGQSVINIKSGGRGRLSTLISGLMLLLIVVFFKNWLSIIPMAALVSVMIMVSIGTFSWNSLWNIKKYPLTSNIVMLTTVAVVVATHNLAYGVLVGVLLGALFFANKIRKLIIVDSIIDHHANIKTYNVKGQIFFASSEKFIESFDFNELINKVIINVSNANFWDVTSVSSLDKVILKFKRKGINVEVIGINNISSKIIECLGKYNNSKELDKLSCSQ